MGIQFDKGSVRLFDKNGEELTRPGKEPAKEKRSPDARKAERVRRDQIRDSINALDPAQQKEAWKAELQRRDIWDQCHGERQHKTKADLTGTEQTLSQVNDHDMSNPQLSWWEKVILRKRVKGGPRDQSDAKGDRLPI